MSAPRAGLSRVRERVSPEQRSFSDALTGVLARAGFDGEDLDPLVNEAAARHAREFVAQRALSALADQRYRAEFAAAWEINAHSMEEQLAVLVAHYGSAQRLLGILRTDLELALDEPALLDAAARVPVAEPAAGDWNAALAALAAAPRGDGEQAAQQG